MDLGFTGKGPARNGKNRMRIDQYAYSSRLRNKNPGLKCAFTIITLLFSLVLSSVRADLFVILTMCLLTVFFGGFRLRQYGRLFLLPAVFLLCSGIPFMLNIEKSPPAVFSIPFGRLFIGISPSSLLAGLSLTMTALSCISCFYFLILNTPVNDLFSVLKKIHCPSLILELMYFIYRFIFLLSDTGISLQRAQLCRLANRTFFTRLWASASLWITIFLRAFQKASKLYDAMEVRCYNGHLPVYDKKFKLNGLELVFVLIFEIILLLLGKEH